MLGPAYLCAVLQATSYKNAPCPPGMWRASEPCVVCVCCCWGETPERARGGRCDVDKRSFSRKAIPVLDMRCENIECRMRPAPSLQHRLSYFTVPIGHSVPVVSGSFFSRGRSTRHARPPTGDSFALSRRNQRRRPAAGRARFLRSCTPCRSAAAPYQIRSAQHPIARAPIDDLYAPTDDTLTLTYPSSQTQAPPAPPRQGRMGCSARPPRQAEPPGARCMPWRGRRGRSRCRSRT